MRGSLDAVSVSCPLRAGGAVVDIEVCMACPKLLRVVDDDPPYVVCNAWRSDPLLNQVIR